MFVNCKFSLFGILSILFQLFPQHAYWLQSYCLIYSLPFFHILKDRSTFYGTFFIYILAFELSFCSVLTLLLLSGHRLDFLWFRLNIFELWQADPGKYFFGFDDILDELLAISLEINIIAPIFLDAPQQIVLAVGFGQSLQVLLVLL